MIKKNLSIIIPTLNEEKYIGKLLKCLEGQTYKDFEVIVVDGGSIDKTRQILKGFWGLKLKVFLSKDNLSNNRNLGVTKARNNLILFLDADVLMDNYYLEKSIQEIQELHAQIATSTLRPIERSWYNILFIAICNIAIRFAQHIKPVGFGCCTFTTKEIHNAINGWDVAIGWGNDLNYVKRSSRHGNFKVLSTEVGYSMRRFEMFGTKTNIKNFLLAYLYTITGQDRKIANIDFEFGRF